MLTILTYYLIVFSFSANVSYNNIKDKHKGYGKQQ